MGRPRKEEPKIHCRSCGKELERKIFNGRIEDLSVFKKRRYCNRECMSKAMVHKQVTLSGYRERARKLLDSRCGICGTDRNLQCHHVNKDVSDNRRENVQTLCASCHSTWHRQNGKTSPKRSNWSCSICGEPARKSGMCQKHYQRLRKYGDPLMTKKKIGSRYELVVEAPGVKSGQLPED